MVGEEEERRWSLWMLLSTSSGGGMGGGWGGGVCQSKHHQPIHFPLQGPHVTLLPVCTTTRGHSLLGIYNMWHRLFPMSDGEVILCQSFLSLASTVVFIIRSLTPCVAVIMEVGWGGHLRLLGSLVHVVEVAAESLVEVSLCVTCIFYFQCTNHQSMSPWGLSWPWSASFRLVTLRSCSALSMTPPSQPGKTHTHIIIFISRHLRNLTCFSAEINISRRRP